MSRAEGGSELCELGLDLRVGCDDGPEEGAGCVMTVSIALPAVRVIRREKLPSAHIAQGMGMLLSELYICFEG